MDSLLISGWRSLLFPKKRIHGRYQKWDTVVTGLKRVPSVRFLSNLTLGGQKWCVWRLFGKLANTQSLVRKPGLFKVDAYALHRNHQLIIIPDVLAFCVICRQTLGKAKLRKWSVMWIKSVSFIAESWNGEAYMGASLPVKDTEWSVCVSEYPWPETELQSWLGVFCTAGQLAPLLNGEPP